MTGRSKHMPILFTALHPWNQILISAHQRIGERQTSSGEYACRLYLCQCAHPALVPTHPAHPVTNTAYTVDSRRTAKPNPKPARRITCTCRRTLGTASASPPNQRIIYGVIWISVGSEFIHTTKKLLMPRMRVLFNILELHSPVAADLSNGICPPSNNLTNVGRDMPNMSRRFLSGQSGVARSNEHGLPP